MARSSPIVIIGAGVLGRLFRMRLFSGSKVLAFIDAAKTGRMLGVPIIAQADDIPLPPGYTFS